MEVYSMGEKNMSFEKWQEFHCQGELLSWWLHNKIAPWHVALGMVAGDGPNLYISDAYHKAFLEVRCIQ